MSFVLIALFKCDIWMKNKEDAIFEQRAYLSYVTCEKIVSDAVIRQIARLI